MSEPTSTSDQVTIWLAGWRRGDEHAGERLIEAVYPDLRRIAARFLADERGSHTLEPGALVHELWIRMREGEKVTFEDRSHFFALAARAMRRVLIDHARARVAEKRGGDRRRVSLTAVAGWNPADYDEDVLSLHAALSELEGADPRAARIVELKFFGGLEGREIAQVLGISEITVKRDWRVARAWLMSRLKSGTWSEG